MTIGPAIRRAKGPFHSSLGQRPRSRVHRHARGLKARSIGAGDGAGLQPLRCFCDVVLGRCPQAEMERAVGAEVRRAKRPSAPILRREWRPRVVRIPPVSNFDLESQIRNETYWKGPATSEAPKLVADPRERDANSFALTANVRIPSHSACPYAVPSFCSVVRALRG